MALSLRELLDKQRAEREARERVPNASAEPLVQNVAVEGNSSNSAQPLSSALAPSPQPLKRNGLFGRFVPQSAPAPADEKPVASGAASAAREHAEAAPATPAPPQVPLPSYSEDETENLRKNLAFLAANLDEKEVLGQILRTTVRQIQTHPELSAIMIDSDFELIVAAARQSMRYTARRKEEKSDAKAKKQSQKDELKAFLKDQGVDFDF